MDEKDVGESSTNQLLPQNKTEEKKPVGRKLFSPRKEKANERRQERPIEDEDMLTRNFNSKEESSMGLNCNVVYVLSYEYNQMTGAEETKEADEVEMAKHKTICYYVMNNDAVEEQNAFFEHPDQGIKNHLKPLFIRGKVENVGLNRRRGNSQPDSIIHAQNDWNVRYKPKYLQYGLVELRRKSGSHSGRNPNGSLYGIYHQTHHIYGNYLKGKLQLAA